MAWYRCVGGAGGSLKLRTASGRIATFSTNMVAPFNSLKTDINPVQDLHGYSKPWSGGGGKNKLDYLSNLRATDSGLTISATSGGAIHYQGTAINNYCMLTYKFNLSIPSGTTITVSRDVSVGYQHYFDFTFTDNSIEYVRIMPNTTSTTYTLPKDLKNIDIVCLGLTVGTAYNETVKFQLEIGSPATSWEPYENICPISGFANSVISRTGKNLLNGDEFADNFAGCSDYSKDTTNKTVKFTHSAGITEDLLCYVLQMPFKANTQYTLILSYKAVARNTSLRIFYTDGTTSYCDLVATTEKTPFSIVSTANKTIKYIAVGYWGAGLATLYYDECGLFEGVVTLADFEPFAGSKYQSFFKGLMEGTYDVFDLSTLAWVYNGSLKRWEAQKTDMKSYGSRSADVLFEEYETDTTATAGSENKGFISGLVIYVASTDSVNSPTGMCIYPLATATTPTITQAELDTLVSAFGADVIAIPFGQTVYGGKIDATSGKVKITHASITLVGTETWYYTSTLNRVYTPIADAKRPSLYAEILSDILHYTYNKEDYGAYINDQGNLIVFAPASITDANSWKTWLGNNNIQVVYELATPIEITVLPENFQALNGVNNVYGDTNGDSEVKYLYRE